MPDQETVTALMRTRWMIDENPALKGSSIYYVDVDKSYAFRKSDSLVENKVVIEKTDATEKKSASKYLLDVGVDCGPVMLAGVSAAGEEAVSLGTLTPLAALTLASGAAGAYKCGVSIGQLSNYLSNPSIAEDMENAKAHPYFNFVNDAADAIQIVKAVADLKGAVATARKLTDLRASWFKSRNWLKPSDTKKYFREFVAIMGPELKDRNFADALKRYGYERSFSLRSNPANVYINKLRLDILKTFGKDIVYDSIKLGKTIKTHFGSAAGAEGHKNESKNTTHRVHITQSVNRKP